MKLLRTSLRKHLPATMLTAALLGCSDPSAPREALLWEAEFSAFSGAFDAMAAMVATQNDTQIGIGIDGGSNGTRLGWAVRTGQCDATGQRIAAAATFPAVTISSGAGTAEAVIRRRIAGDEPYAIEVFSNADGSGQILACGDFSAGL